jgi:single-strand DNA-binding protein
MNQVTLIGRLGKDPIVRTMPDGGAVANMSLATDESFKNQKGEKIKKTEWHSVVTFGKLAETCQDYLKKGRLICVEGKLRTRDWTDKDGIKRYTTEVVMNNMHFLDSVKKEESAPDAPPPMSDDTQCVNMDSVPF